MVFVAEVVTCVGFHACRIACKDRADLPDGLYWLRVQAEEGGRLPDVVSALRGEPLLPLRGAARRGSDVPWRRGTVEGTVPGAACRPGALAPTLEGIAPLGRARSVVPSQAEEVGHLDAVLPQK